MRWFLGLDQSTSATKAMLFDENGVALDREARAHGQFCPAPGWVEHDAEEIWSNVLTVARCVLARHPECVAGLAGISIANQRETVVVFARDDGSPLHPAIVWQCRRGDAYCTLQQEAGRTEAIHARTGLKPDGYFSAPKLQWLMRQRPELARLVGSGAALVGTMDAYLVYRLTRGAVFATDATNASRTLLFDLARLDWDEEMCGWWDVPPAALPEVRECTARYGETTLEGTLPRPVPICGVMGDSQAALLAQRCIRPGDTKVTFGTGSSVLMNLGDRPRFSQRGVLTALAWVCQGRPAYAFEGIIISSAATLAWLRDSLGLFSDFAECEPLAASVPDTGGVYLVPAFSGLGLPHWEPAARAAIVGLTGASDRRHVVRAGVESIAYQIRDALDAMRGEARLPLAAVRADGGATENRLLMQFTADLVGVDVAVAPMPECSCLGAALAGMIGVGRFGGVDELAAAPAGAVVYRPVRRPEELQRLYAGWGDAVRRVLPAPAAPRQ